MKAIVELRHVKETWVASLLGAVFASLPLPASATTGPAQSGLIAQASNAVNANLNPAGLTRIRQPEWVAQALYFNSTSDFEYRSDQQPGKFSDKEGGSSYVPLIYYARPLTDRLGLGAFLTGNSFGEDLDDSGPSRYLVKEWDLLTASLVVNLGYRLTEEFSIGGGVSLDYTSFEIESDVLNLEPGASDGEMKFEDSDVTVGWTAGVLYEFTPTTRAGLTYRSDIEPSLSDRPSFKNIGPLRQALFDAGLGVFNRSVGLNIRLPQAVFGGVFHEFANGDSVSLDGGWVDFSDFGFTEVTLGDTTLDSESNKLDDIWVGTLGYSHQLNEQWKASIGGMYISSALDDKNRSYSFKLDRVWGVGVGAEYKWKDSLIFGLNLNYYDLGKARTEAFIDQTGETLNGKYSDHYAIGLDFTLRWIR